MSELRCTECGRFVSYHDVAVGRATHELVTPESAYTRERFETICARCNSAVSEETVRNFAASYEEAP